MPSWWRLPPTTSSRTLAPSPRPAPSRPPPPRRIGYLTFGMRPTRPATEYGYICAGPPVAPGVFEVERFVEKPDVETAKCYIAEGFLWNSGNFVFRAGFLLNEYRRFEPGSSAAVAAAVKAAGTNLTFVTLDPQAFKRATTKSIDYAVMERTERAAVMPVAYGWSDVGSWQAVWELSERDAAGNAAQGLAVFVDARELLRRVREATRCSVGLGQCHRRRH